MAGKRGDDEMGGEVDIISRVMSGAALLISVLTFLFSRADKRREHEAARRAVLPSIQLNTQQFQESRKYQLYWEFQNRADVPITLRAIAVVSRTQMYLTQKLPDPGSLEPDMTRAVQRWEYGQPAIARGATQQLAGFLISRPNEPRIEGELVTFELEFHFSNPEQSIETVTYRHQF